MQIEAGGHGYSAGREIKGLSDLLERTGNIKSVAAEAAQNTLTHAQEFSWGDIFMNFSYQNKSGKLLANGRQIESINDANEIGGDRMGRVMDALNHMIADKNIDESIVVSEDLGYGRHFIYRYRKGEDNTIEGLAFEYQGNKEELSNVVNRLGKRALNDTEINSRNPFDFSNPLFFTKDNRNDVSDLAKAALDSFQTEERKSEMNLYIHRLKRDTDDYEGLKSRRRQQEKELEREYEKIILKDDNAKKGIANAVYGMIKATERMVVSEGRRREESSRWNIFTKKEIDPDGIKQDKIWILPETIDHTGRLLVTDVVAGVNSENGNMNPFLPESAGSLKSESGGVLKELIMAVFKPIPDSEHFLSQQVISITDGAMGFHPDSREFLYGGENAELLGDERSFKEVLIGLLPVLDEEKEDEPLKSQNKERLPVLIMGLQQGLEAVAIIIKSEENKGLTDDRKEEKIKQQQAERDCVNLGEEIIVAILKEEQFSQKDAFSQLVFLLFSYKDKNSSKAAKQLISALIYKQIEIMYEDKTLMAKFPQLESIIKKFQLLSPRTKLLKSRFTTLIFILEKLYSEDIIFREMENGQDLLRKIIFWIFGIKKLRNVNEDYSEQRLIYSSVERLITHYLFRYPYKKKVKKRAKRGIIYFHPTCFIESIYDKIEGKEEIL